MKHLTSFETFGEYSAFLNSQNYENPNVSYISSGESSEYNRFLTLKLKSPSGAIEINKVGTASNLTASIQYSLDRGLTWQNYTFDGSQGLHIVLNKNYDKHGCDNIKFKGINTKFSHSTTTYYNFAMSGDFFGRGDVTSLINGIGGDCALPNFAFVGLFSGCTTLLTSPKVPSTTLSKYCYGNMFKWCSSLKEGPELPAMNLAESCYYVMFGNCSGIKKSPKLPATVMKTQCYCAMFQNASGLSDVSEINFSSAVTLAEDCYGNMFRGTNLSAAPELPMKTLAKNCYRQMFSVCCALTTSPDLMATTLAESCYRGMFQNCINLTHAPNICASVFPTCACCTMFANCYSLQIPPVISASTQVGNRGMAAMYQLTKISAAPELPATAVGQYSYWSMFWGCESLIEPPSLLPSATLADSCYRGMFQGCTSLTSAPELPATTLASYCYGGMFRECKSLASAPELPATTLKNDCYVSMFTCCSTLTVAPELPATALSTQCYYGMFEWTGLLTAPELPATNLAADAYWCMFFGSKSLTGAPYIASPTNPAATPSRVYQRMFEGCNNLTYIKAMFTSWPVVSNGNEVTGQWVYQVKSTGTFVANANASFLSNPPRGAAGIPNNWTIQTATE